MNGAQSADQRAFITECFQKRQIVASLFSLFVGLKDGVSCGLMKTDRTAEIITTEADCDEG